MVHLTKLSPVLPEIDLHIWANRAYREWCAQEKTVGKMKLQFTNGYRPRFDQISRIMQYLLSKDDQGKISRLEILAALGIPDKQVENLTSMMTGFGLVQSRTSKLTPLGKAIIQRDPYFEKIETLWIIHYIVSSNPEWVVWYRIVNDVMPTLDRFSVESISKNFFSDLSIQFSQKTISEKLPKEVSAVFASYTRSELARLGILSQVGQGDYIRGNPEAIPSFAFLFCLVNYRDRFSPGSSAINVETICLAENSPGRVFNIPEYQVRNILEELHLSGHIRLEQFGNLDQVRFSETLTQSSVADRLLGG